jgi:hypothetical protein
MGLLVDLHWGTHAKVKAFGAESVAFNIHGGVHQGCNIAPTLFNLYLHFVTKQASATLGIKVGVRVAFKHTSKQLFTNAQQMDSITWISLMLYADDVVLIAEFAD